MAASFWIESHLNHEQGAQPTWLTTIDPFHVSDKQTCIAPPRNGLVLTLIESPDSKQAAGTDTGQHDFRDDAHAEPSAHQGNSKLHHLMARQTMERASEQQKEAQAIQTQQLLMAKTQSAACAQLC